MTSKTVETENQGLKRAFMLTIPAKDIEARVDQEVKRIAPQVRMPGFRPGKVPPNLIKKMHGDAIQRDALQVAVQEGVQKLLDENKVRPALQPEVVLDEKYEPGKDAEVRVSLEALPDIPEAKIDGLTLERLTVDADEKAVDEQSPRDGEVHVADVIIFATGFKSTEFLAPMRIVGRNGRLLADEWRAGARAYLGVTVSGFPNFFMLYGPNTNLGHNSILVMIEAQADYIVDVLKKMQVRGVLSIDVKQAVLEQYNRELQADLAKSVWSTAAASWYKLPDGTITNNWPHSTIRYKRMLREVRLEDYDT